MEFEEGSDGGYDGGEGLARMRSLMDGDLEELKGFLDLGFGFSYDEIPGLQEGIKLEHKAGSQMVLYYGSKSITHQVDKHSAPAQFQGIINI
ncbi:hypothetical protein ZIOFF_047609 [Zingiber officinale]|uniref:Uncharacterized protein n=1 Tax=Zingiber officinale TaxID=94328 RepID=A0A8J5FR40_ZINOF|nr:hypothetical protein ZIOFF_047609 [Zingiber officinale]